MEYEVSGAVAPDGSEIVLTGTLPLWDPNCVQVGTKPDRMTFQFLGPASRLSFDEAVSMLLDSEQ